MTYDVVVTDKKTGRLVETISSGESEADAIRIARSVRVNLDHSSYRVDTVNAPENSNG